MSALNLTFMPSDLLDSVSARTALDFEAITAAAIGNYVSTIFPSVGINLVGNGSKHQACPLCGGRDRWRCDDKQGAGTWICSQCGAGNGFMLVQQFTGLDAYETNKLIASALGLDASERVSDEQRDEWRSQQVEREVAEDEAKVAARADAVLRSHSIWENARDVSPQHPYLLRKSIGAPTLRQNSAGQLIVPMYQYEVLVNVQTIAFDGKKLFLSGGAVSGAYHIIYNNATVDDGILLLCEGYATGATVFNAMQGKCPVVVAFNAYNLIPVAGSMREQYPTHRIIICADDDKATAIRLRERDITEGKTPKPLEEYNAGLRDAQKAAALVGGEVIIPKFEQKDVAK